MKIRGFENKKINLICKYVLDYYFTMTTLRNLQILENRKPYKVTYARML